MYVCMYVCMYVTIYICDSSIYNNGDNSRNNDENNNQYHPMRWEPEKKRLLETTNQRIVHVTSTINSCDPALLSVFGMVCPKSMCKGSSHEILV